ncbi:hypothetical protein AB0H45_29815 [Streptomyces atroolivaceus]|uniref:Biopolymer transporter Tol n=1 Tax=Streptomyces atroolivaceus TaxID=66869 RepID=A0ABV9VA20_STRAZ|nr:hypothetical protein [Streptomyces atroolivaceus]
MDPAQPERTPDGRYIVVHGRRWRATDPEIPEDVAAGLRRHLMAARRAVGVSRRKGDTAAEGLARRRVHRAKVALGERGTPWWEQSLSERRRRWEDGAAELDADRPDEGRAAP